MFPHGFYNWVWHLPICKGTWNHLTDESTFWVLGWSCQHIWAGLDGLPQDSGDSCIHSMLITPSSVPAHWFQGKVDRNPVISVPWFQDRPARFACGICKINGRWPHGRFRVNLPDGLAVDPFGDVFVDPVDPFGPSDVRKFPWPILVFVPHRSF